MATAGSMNTYWSTTKKYVLAHKIISGIVLVVVIGLGWWIYSNATSTSGETRYVLGTVASSTIISTVSESGQVSTTNSVDIKPQVSGEITWVGVKAGDVVHAGQALATIDDTTAVQAIEDAKSQLQTDELTYQQAAAQAPVNYQNDQTALANDQTNLQDDYNNMYNDLTGVYLDLPAVVAESQDVLYGSEFDTTKKGVWNKDVLYNIFNPAAENVSGVQSFQLQAVNDYTTGNADYASALATYKTLTRTSSTASLDAMLAQSITMQTAVAQALQTELNFLGAASDLAQKNAISLPANFSTVQSSARSNLATANDDLTKLLADQKTLTNDKQSITNAQQTITLDQVGNAPDGSNPISLQVSANSIAKEKQDIANQEADLADYTIVAPFDGTISAVDAQVGDTAGGTAVATIITNDQIADLSVNEVDAAKIKLGQKAILTFDAIDGLTLTGTVAEIDSVGTVSQGVVSYNIQISFDTQDPRVKPGMTINADIQTDVVQDTLVVPSSAVKTVGGNSYVQVFTPPLANTGGTAGVTSTIAPTMVPVTTGVSDNTNIQILSGLVVGEQIVTSVRTGTATVTKTAASAATTRTPGAGGFGGGGAGGIRIGG